MLSWRGNYPPSRYLNSYGRFGALPMPTGPPLITVRRQHPRRMQPILRPFFRPPPVYLPATTPTPARHNSPVEDSTQEFMKWVCIMLILTLTFWSTNGEVL